EELGVLGDGARPAALDEADAELVEQRGDEQLVLHGQVHALLLRAVAQGRVVDVEAVKGGVHWSALLGWSAAGAVPGDAGAAVLSSPPRSVAGSGGAGAGS